MKIIKRSGAENTFDKEKIENAVAKANITVEEKDRLSEGEIGEIAQNIACATASTQWQSIISHTAMSVLSSDRLILLTSRYFLFLTSRTRKSSRKIPIRTLLSIQFRGIIWQVK